MCRPHEETIFHTVRKIENLEARREYLDQICAGDAALRERVNALLEVDEKEQEFLKSSPDATRTAEHPSLTERPGTTIGRYKLMEQIGEGGMGTVFVADQERPIRRKVALKVIKPGMDTKAVVARFEAERQALALMDHPNIAKVLDAGTTDSGRPYFVMELVCGIPITEYCDEHNLTLTERLELFTHVCQAIQHAHQKAIIHRDIKPSNVLVTEQDGKAVPKVIDFGVAKALNQRLTDRTIYTSFAQVVGTPLYMSPEQAALSAVDVDTRSDVYSLGVLLYELLTSTTPFDRQRFEEAAFEEIRRIVREEEPPKPSTKISTLGETGSTVAQNRRTEPGRLGQAVRGDLDWIVMKSIDKDRSRRYESPSRLADEIDNFLNARPIKARPPSVSYQVWKLWARNRVYFSAATAIVLALALGLGIASRALVQEQRTNTELMTTVTKLNQAQVQLREERAGAIERNAELARALKRWSEELYGRAIAAAVVQGDVDAVIDDLRSVGIAPAWESKVRGLLALHRGEITAAYDVLKKAATDSPDAGTLALLAKACLESGRHDEYLKCKARLSNLEPKSDEDKLLFALATIYGDIERGEQAMQELVRRKPSPLALAVHSEALAKLYGETGEPSLCEAMERERSAARLMMPDSSLVALMEFYAHFEAVLGGDESEIRQRQLEDASQELGRYKGHPIANHAQACYYDYKNNFKAAHKTWEAMDNPGVWYIYFAASKYRSHDYPAAIRILEELQPQFLIDYYLGEAYALEPTKRETALATYQGLVRRLTEFSFGPDDVDAVPETILLLMGDKGAQAAAQGRLVENATSGLNKRVLQFIADSRLPPSFLLEIANGRSKQAKAHKIVAARFLHSGDIENAQKHLKACSKAYPTHPDAYWAEAISARLDNDPNLRQRIEQRKAGLYPDSTDD